MLETERWRARAENQTRRLPAWMVLLLLAMQTLPAPAYASDDGSGEGAAYRGRLSGAARVVDIGTSVQVGAETGFTVYTFDVTKNVERVGLMIVQLSQPIFGGQYMRASSNDPGARRFRPTTCGALVQFLNGDFEYERGDILNGSRTRAEPLELNAARVFQTTTDFQEWRLRDLYYPNPPSTLTTPPAHEFGWGGAEWDTPIARTRVFVARAWDRTRNPPTGQSDTAGTAPPVADRDRVSVRVDASRFFVPGANYCVFALEQSRTSITAAQVYRATDVPTQDCDSGCPNGESRARRSPRAPSAIAASLSIPASGPLARWTRTEPIPVLGCADPQRTARCHLGYLFEAVSTDGVPASRDNGSVNANAEALACIARAGGAPRASDDTLEALRTLSNLVRGLMDARRSDEQARKQLTAALIRRALVRSGRLSQLEGTAIQVRVSDGLAGTTTTAATPSDRSLSAAAQLQADITARLTDLQSPPTPEQRPELLKALAEVQTFQHALLNRRPVLDSSTTPTETATPTPAASIWASDFTWNPETPNVVYFSRSGGSGAVAGVTTQTLFVDEGVSLVAALELVHDEVVRTGTTREPLAAFADRMTGCDTQAECKQLPQLFTPEWDAFMALARAVNPGAAAAIESQAASVRDDVLRVQRESARVAAQARSYATAQVGTTSTTFQDQKSWFTDYVTPSLGVYMPTRLGSNGDAGRWAPTVGAQLYLWPNPVDRPMWFWGARDLRRLLMFEGGITTGPLRSVDEARGRVVGTGPNGHAWYAGAGVQLLPYVTVSGGATWLRTDGLEGSRSSLLPSGYVSVSVQANVPGLVANMIRARAAKQNDRLISVLP